MRVLGFDPSLTGFGWALYDSEQTGKARCPERGRWKTTAREEFVDRFTGLAQNAHDLIIKLKPDKVGVESPSFGASRSETMYALFTHVNAAIKKAQCDVVFFAPDQIKLHPKLLLERPSDWKMMKADMIEAAKDDAGGGVWSGDAADAYWVAWIAEKFWRLHAGTLTEEELNKVERHQFLHQHTYKRGKKKGMTERKGIMFREGERFFLWSKLATAGG